MNIGPLKDEHDRAKERRDKRRRPDSGDALAILSAPMARSTCQQVSDSLSNPLKRTRNDQQGEVGQLLATQTQDKHFHAVADLAAIYKISNDP